MISRQTVWRDYNREKARALTLYRNESEVSIPSVIFFPGKSSQSLHFLVGLMYKAVLRQVGVPLGVL